MPSQLIHLIQTAHFLDSESSTTSKNRYYTANDHSATQQNSPAAETSAKISPSYKPFKATGSEMKYHYNDGGPGPSEPKTVLPEPKTQLYRRRYGYVDTGDV